MTIGHRSFDHCTYGEGDPPWWFSCLVSLYTDLNTVAKKAEMVYTGPLVSLGEQVADNPKSDPLAGCNHSGRLFGYPLLGVDCWFGFGFEPWFL